MEPKRIYLAAPYSHTDSRVRSAREFLAGLEAARLIRDGHLVFSPLSHGHAIARTGLRGDFAFWEQQCLSFLEHWATELHVLALDGWETSVGVAREIDTAHTLGLPVVLRVPETKLEALYA